MPNGSRDGEDSYGDDRVPQNPCPANNLIQNVTNFTVWFALVFWGFLETRSVFVTGMIGGVYLGVHGGAGDLVRKTWSITTRKKRVMLGSSAASFVLYAASLRLMLTCRCSKQALPRPCGAAGLWLFVLVVMLAVIAGTC